MTIEGDVAVELERLRQTRKASLKAVVNEALRHGLRAMAAPPRKRKPFRTRSVDLGKPLIDNIDNVAEVLALIEGEDFR